MKDRAVSFTRKILKTFRLTKTKEGNDLIELENNCSTVPNNGSSFSLFGLNLPLPKWVLFCVVFYFFVALIQIISNYLQKQREKEREKEKLDPTYSYNRPPVNLSGYLPFVGVGISFIRNVNVYLIEKYEEYYV